VLFADLDLGQIDRAHLDLDVVGHYARPDVFQLHVDRRAKTAVTWEGERPTDASGPGGDGDR
ncbi:MAG TPA: nitrilase, partial [Candidatus Dormibacteraeota bacterium]|nr:nitrilase [Candidatus Dormibacteraeota bacterium]